MSAHPFARSLLSSRCYLLALSSLTAPSGECHYLDPPAQWLQLPSTILLTTGVAVPALLGFIALVLVLVLVLLVLQVAVTILFGLLALFTALSPLFLIAAVTTLRRRTNQLRRPTAWPTWRTRLDVLTQHLLAATVIAITLALTFSSWWDPNSDIISVVWDEPSLLMALNAGLGVYRYRKAPATLTRPLAKWLPGGRAALPTLPLLPLKPSTAPDWAAPLTKTLGELGAPPATS